MNVLFLTHRLPYRPNRGDRVRAFHILRTLAEKAHVDLISLAHDDEEAGHADDLRQVARSVTVAPVGRLRNLARVGPALLRGTPLTHVLLDSAGMTGAIAEVARVHPPDVVLAFCSGMARFALHPALRERGLVVDLVDVDSRKWQDLACQTAPPKRWIYAREARRLARFERFIAGRASATLVVNAREAELATTLAPEAAVHVVPNGLDVDALRPSAVTARPRQIVFCGVMSYEPNAQAARWFLEEVWPSLRRLEPSATVAIVGADPPAWLKRLAEGEPRVTVTGSVEDVRPFLWTSSVSVAPLWVARGVQNKVLEAAAAGLPSVVTPAVHDGLPAEVLPVCRVAGSADTFVSELASLLRQSDEERAALMNRVDLEPLEWRRRLADLWPILERAVGPAAATRGRLQPERSNPAEFPTWSASPQRPR